MNKVLFSRRDQSGTIGPPGRALKGGVGCPGWAVTRKREEITARDDGATRPHTVKLFELHEKDPALADRLVFGRVPHPDRRGFLKGAGLAAMGALVGAAIPFHRTMPAGFVPLAIAATEGRLPGKDGLIVLNDRPVNAETPAHLLNDDVTPTNRHFVRNNGIPPDDMDAESWRLTIDGLVDTPMTLSIADLTDRFEVVMQQLTIECGGNGRAFFEPPASSRTWSTPPTKGPTSTSRTTRTSRRYRPPERRPLRLVIPGWPGSCSQKWLTRVWLRDKVHDGAKMTGTSYRVPRYPVAPGTKVAKEDFVIIEAMPVRSLITAPESGITLEQRELAVHGHA